MSDVDELALTIHELGAGPWDLTLEGGETVTVDLDEVQITEEHGFEAEGRDADDDALVELSTGIQPGGSIQLRRRPVEGEAWTVAGEVVAADKRDHV